MPHFTHVYARLIEARLKRDRRHLLLLGPRQVGKSTLLGSLEPDLTLNLASLATDRAGKVTRRIVVFLGARRQRIDGVEALPIDDFLAELPA